MAGKHTAPSRVKQWWPRASSTLMPHTLWAIVAFSVLLLLVGCIGRNVSKQGSQSHRPPTPKSSATPVVNNTAERGVGVITGSWGEVLALSSQEGTWTRVVAMDEAMAARARGFNIPIEAIMEQTANEIANVNPDMYVWTANKNLPGWLNTNWDRLPIRIGPDNFVVGDQFLVMELDILAKYGVDTTTIPKAAIVWHNGEWCVILARKVCFNHVWPGSAPLVCKLDLVANFHKRPPPPTTVRTLKEKINTSPISTPHWETNPYTQDDKAYDTGGTNNYVVDNVEVVEAKRGLGEGTTGTGGTGTGGTTPGAVTVIDNVTVVGPSEPAVGPIVDGDSGVAVEPATTVDPVDLGND